MTLRLLTMLGLSLSLVMFTGCDDDDDNNEPVAGETTGGEATGGEAGGEAGDEAGGEAGDEAGDEAGGEAGDEAGEETVELNIVETAVEDGRFETLVIAVTAANLADTLSGEGPFTVLAPVDTAFDALPEGTLETLLMDAENDGELLANILKLHVIGGAVLSSDLTDDQEIETLGGNITANVGETVTFTSGDSVATVVVADVTASNGVIHAIDAVLLPPSEEPAEKNIVETAIDNGSFETLVIAVTAANLAETLSGEGPFTVLAPVDTAFDALEEGTLDTLLMDAENDGELLANILKLHVISGAVLSSELTNDQEIETLNGNIIANVSETVTFTSGDTVATVVIPDVIASNGVIHAIDTVLLPASEEPAEKNIVETAVDDGRFETLVIAVTAANLAETLSGEGPFTVLAPVDTAFDALPEGTLDTLLMDAENDGELLANILKLHVISGAVLSTDLTDDQTVETLNGNIIANVGETVTFTSGSDGDEVVATVVVPDVVVSNGVIHAIDTVLQ